MHIFTEAKSCIYKTLKAETEGTISGILARQPLSYGNSICSINMTNIPKYSLVEFTMDSYTCISGCWCISGGSTYLCDYISIKGSIYPHFDRSSTSPLYVYATGGRFIIAPVTTAVISFNITYRGE